MRFMTVLTSNFIMDELNRIYDTVILGITNYFEN